MRPIQYHFLITLHCYAGLEHFLPSFFFMVFISSDFYFYKYHYVHYR